MKQKLLLAFSALLLGILPAQAAQLSLPANITGTIGQTVPVPLTIDNAAGILSIDLKIQYNSALLEATSVTDTDLTEAGTLTSNVSVPGQVAISFFDASPLNGNGTLFNIAFKIVGTGASSPQIVECILGGEDSEGNEIQIPCNEAEPPAALDHFFCYTTKLTRGAEKFIPLSSLSLVDQFETRLFDVQKPETLCNPVEKTLSGGSSEEILDPNTHLRGYQIKLTKTDPKQPKHEKQSNLKITNQLGTIFVETLQPDRVLVPTAKSLTGPIDEPDPASHNVDHYKCYTVKVEARVCENNPSTRCRGDEDCGAEGTCNLGFPKDLTATLVDQFDESKVYDIEKPTRLCPPVDKSNEGIKDSDAHLMCYQVKPVKGLCLDSAPINAGGICQREQNCGGERNVTSLCVFQEKHDTRLGVHVNNQFGPEQLDTVKQNELCVPSQKTLPPT